jgi:hypothetical protein
VQIDEGACCIFVYLLEMAGAMWNSAPQYSEAQISIVKKLLAMNVDVGALRAFQAFPSKYLNLFNISEEIQDCFQLLLDERITDVDFELIQQREEIKNTNLELGVVDFQSIVDFGEALKNDPNIMDIPLDLSVRRSSILAIEGPSVEVN